MSKDDPFFMLKKNCHNACANWGIFLGGIFSAKEYRMICCRSVIRILLYICTMKKKNITSKFEIYINGQTFEVSSLLEAEKKWKNAVKAEADSYIIRKDYDSNGKLLETYYVG